MGRVDGGVLFVIRKILDLFLLALDYRISFF